MRTDNIYAFPEFHLSGFPTQVEYKRKDAKSIVKRLIPKKQCFYVTGYIEKDKDKRFSSAIIYDNGRYLNIRKRYPYKDERTTIDESNEEIKILDLSIGKSILFICNDIIVDFYKSSIQNIINAKGIDNIIYISAMKDSFDKWINILKEKKENEYIQRIIFADRYNGSGIV